MDPRGLSVSAEVDSMYRRGDSPRRQVDLLGGALAAYADPALRWRAARALLGASAAHPPTDSKAAAEDVRKAQWHLTEGFRDGGAHMPSMHLTKAAVESAAIEMGMYDRRKVVEAEWSVPSWLNHAKTMRHTPPEWFATYARWCRRQAERPAWETAAAWASTGRAPPSCSEDTALALARKGAAVGEDPSEPCDAAAVVLLADLLQRKGQVDEAKSVLEGSRRCVRWNRRVEEHEREVRSRIPGLSKVEKSST